MAKKQSGIWISLPRLLSLPLPAAALAVLWRDLLLSLPADAHEERQALEQALMRHELSQHDVLIDQDRWEQMFSRLESLVGQLSEAELAGHLADLTPRLYQFLVHQAGPDPAPEVMADERRAELLWLSDNWMRRFEQLPFERPDPLPLMAEHLCRYGALTWMRRKGPQARLRALSLLQRLHALLPEARDWVLPSIRERLILSVEELSQEGELADPDQLQELLEACRCLADEEALTSERRSAIDGAVFRGLASLQLWRQIND
ncbi:hypothetical protein [Cyanobium sp. ATX 6F1]|uniref:hypothetical protein n=1 Tax=unclassified Cyanobium TaxID=2627006 RepID=UPI0020CE4BBC|nr:hypothetical protein [Cyanobium sp. ATX 6F1]MCP9917502.1 hypothetical protein [Cyanobium sp. ATX 6F1]